METKICTKCGLEKPITEFNFVSKKTGVRKARCKECQYARQRELYETRYKGRYKVRLKQNKSNHREIVKQLIDDIKQQGCCVCGEKDPCCLDFHHLRDKQFCISNATDRSISKIKEELEKCIVLCANCHRKLHAKHITLQSVRFDSGATNITII